MENQSKQSERFVRALIWAFMSKKVDSNKLRDKLIAYPHLIDNSADMDSILKCMTEAYNYRTRSKKEYLPFIYDEEMKERYAWYEKKYGYIYEKHAE